MIELYSGTPGSGKSLHAAKEIRSRLRFRKCVIIGNFFVNTKAIKGCKGTYIFVDNYRLTPDRLLLFSRRYARHLGRRLKEGEVLLLIDEAQLLFNSREWQNIGRQGWLSFFSQHRHYGYDVVLMAQFDRMLDRQVRALIENDVVHRKVSRAGYMGFFVGLLCNNNLYVAVTQWYPIHQKIDSTFFVGTKKLFAIYDSYNHFEAPGSPSEWGDRGPTMTKNPEKNALSERLAKSAAAAAEEQDDGLVIVSLDDEPADYEAVNC